MCFEGMEGKPSWIIKVIITIKEVRDHLHHGLKKAYFVAWLAAKDTKLVVLHCLRPLLLKSKSILPCEIRLVPVVCGDIRDRRIRWLIRRNYCRVRRIGIHRITPEMLNIWICVVAAVSMARSTPCPLPVMASSHFVLC